MFILDSKLLNTIRHKISRHLHKVVGYRPTIHNNSAVGSMTTEPQHSWLQQQIEGQAFVFNEKNPLNPIKTVRRETSQISYKIVALNCTIAMVAFY